MFSRKEVIGQGLNYDEKVELADEESKEILLKMNLMMRTLGFDDD